MKKLIRWSSAPFLLLLIIAGWILWEQYTMAGLITVILTFVGMAAVLIWGSETAALVSSIYGALVVGMILPRFPVTFVQIGKGLIRMVNPIPFDGNVVGLLVLLTVYILALCHSYAYFEQKRHLPLWIVVLRVVVQTLVLLLYSARVLGDGTLIAELIVFIGMIALIYDAKMSLSYEPTHGWWNALSIVMVILVGTVLFGCDAEEISRWVKMEEGWFSAFLAALVSGALLLDRDVREQRRIVDSAGWYPVVWAAVLLIMSVWPEFLSVWGLYLWFPLMGMLVGGLIDRINPHRWIGKERAILKWGLIAFLVLLLIKADRMGRMVSIVVLLLVAAGGIMAWRATKAAEKTSECRQKCGLGIGAVLLSFTLGIGDTVLQHVTPSIVMMAVLCCLIWCLICQMENMLSESDTSMYPDEFALLKWAVWLAPVLLLVACVLRIWTGI